MLGRSDELKSCRVRDGSTVQVVSRMRGGGRHKDKTSKAAKKRNWSPEKPEQTPGQEAEPQVEYDVHKLDGNTDAVSQMVDRETKRKENWRWWSWRWR